MSYEQDCLVLSIENKFLFYDSINQYEESFEVELKESYAVAKILYHNLSYLNFKDNAGRWFDGIHGVKVSSKITNS